MKTFKFNTDGNSEEIATIIEQELETINRFSQFDADGINDGFGDDQSRLISIKIIEIELKDEGDSFEHLIEVREICEGEYKADLSLSY